MPHFETVTTFLGLLPKLFFALRVLNVPALFFSLEIAAKKRARPLGKYAIFHDANSVGGLVYMGEYKEDKETIIRFAQLRGGKKREEKAGSRLEGRQRN